MKKTPLKRKTPLKAKSTLKTKTPLKAKTKLQSKNTKPKKKSTVYKPFYPYFCVFTQDLDKCIITGTTKMHGNIHIHHIFGGANKKWSEKYGFLIPLRADWHDMADYGIHFDRNLDLKYKRLCQEYWLEHYGTKEEFIAVFGQWW